MTTHTEVARLKGLIASETMSVASPNDGAVFYSDDEGKNRTAAEAYATAKSGTEEVKSALG
jgi:hypothetical protein